MLQIVVADLIYVAGKLVASARKTSVDPSSLGLSRDGSPDSSNLHTVTLVTGDILQVFVAHIVGMLVGNVFALYVSRDRQHRGQVMAPRHHLVVPTHGQRIPAHQRYADLDHEGQAIHHQILGCLPQIKGSGSQDGPIRCHREAFRRLYLCAT